MKLYLTFLTVPTPYLTVPPPYLTVPTPYLTVQFVLCLAWSPDAACETPRNLLSHVAPNEPSGHDERSQQSATVQIYKIKQCDSTC